MESMIQGIHHTKGWEMSRKLSCRGYQLAFVAAAALWTLAFAAALQAAQPAVAAKRDRAAAAYRRAHELGLRLETRLGEPAGNYLRVVHAFELVYRIDPGYTKTPAALAAAAGVYREMGRQFASDRYYSKSIQEYQFLAAQYPGGGPAIDALYTAAEIYRHDVENPIAARDAYKKFLKIYPHSQRAASAHREIARINHQLALWPSNALPARGRPLQVPESTRLQPVLRDGRDESQGIDRNQSDGEANPANSPRGAMEEIKSIHDWVGPDYTRVVIELSGQVTFHALHLENPPRLVFDLAGSRLSPELASKDFPVENGFLQRVRVAQFQPTVARVVLDVPRIENYSVFSLPHPFRLVIDIHGAAKSVEARASAPSIGFMARRARSSTPAHEGPFSQPPFETAPESAVTSEGINRVAPNGSARSRLAGSSASHRIASPAQRNGSENLPASAAPPVPAAEGGSPTLTRALGLKIRRIVIDPGHGGHDTGTIGPSGLEEKNVVLDVALRLRKLIERRMGCQVIMTRSTDTFIPLEERTAIANESSADLFVSIHANASQDPSARGVEIYYLNFTSDPEALELAARENATSQESVYQLQSLVKKIALSEKIGESRQFARIMDARLVSHLDEYGDPQINRGVKKAPFVVLIGANMPSILAEISFLTNPRDERLLREGSFRQMIAVGLYNGIARYAESLGTIRMAQRTPLQPTRQRPPPF